MVKKVLAINPVIDGKVNELYIDMKTPDMTLAVRKVAMASAIAFVSLQGGS